MKKIALLMASVVVLLFASCEKENVVSKSSPGVTTLDVTDVSMTSATFNGKVILPEQIAMDFELGFEVSPTQVFSEQTTRRYAVKSYNKDMTFQATADDLHVDSLYYVRAYMINQMCFYDGEVKEFRTSKFMPTYVDLGLSVKWATTNVGATQPEEYGDYFAWGETEPYYEPGYAQSENPVWKSGKSSGYDWSSYRYCNGSEYTMTKYCNDSSYGYNGYTDNKTVLDMEDDAAHANWGDDWRMPTKAEFEELIDNCTLTWTTLNGKNGYKVVSKVNGNSIFLPAAGFRSGTSLTSAGSGGYYWSSSLYESLSSIARYLCFDSGNHGTGRENRSSGRSVRPVLPCVATDISLSKQSVEIMEGSTDTLTVTVDYENGATGNTATWTSSNTSVAIVNENGVVAAVSVGTCTITATNGTCSATCSVTVIPFEPEYVDLGLSVKWATCNVGATKPEEYGDFFAWGETEPYYEPGYAQSENPVWKSGKSSGYDWPSYRYCNGSEYTMTKYCNGSYYGYNGYTDNKYVLDLEDDAAHANLGDSWRMPTNAEFEELIDNCNWTWTTVNGQNGYKVVSKVNGNSIFLPAAGCRYDTSLCDAGSIGDYWSSSLDKSGPCDACSLDFNSDIQYTNGYYRMDGKSVRPVLPCAATDISLSKQSVEIMEGCAETLIATVDYENGATGNTATWTSSNTSVAIVNENGVVAAVSVGTCTITATYGTYSATCSVIVIPLQFEPEYVDLGLSVKWATCNVGAKRPEEYGDYFAWGETEPYYEPGYAQSKNPVWKSGKSSGYDWPSYRYCKGNNNNLTKYCNNSHFGYNGYTDNKTMLDLEDDAAHANWGYSWRMPTNAEFEELIDNCNWTWTTVNGHEGYKVVSKVNGNSIFLPAAGDRLVAILGNAGSSGNYWSSSLGESSSYGAHALVFYSNMHETCNPVRTDGRSVRPVLR